MLIKQKRRLKKEGKFFTVAGIALAVGAIGLLAGGAGTAIQIEAQEEAAKASQRAENLREKQSRLEAMRARRKEVRQALLERAGIINAAANQGALGSSGQIGGAGSAQSQAGFNVQQINESEAIGAQLFDTNRDISQARSRSATGGAIANFGFTAAQNANTAGRVGAQLFNL